VGAAVRESGQARDGIVLCTKGGYLAFDGARPHDARAYVEETFLSGHPDSGRDRRRMPLHGARYLSDQIDRSRRNLGVGCIDVYYLHNPETQLGEVPRAEFLRRLRLAFEALERACNEGRIGCYGTATWNGYRLETDDEEYLSLAEVLAAARDVAGDQHRFRAVQLPFI